MKYKYFIGFIILAALGITIFNQMPIKSPSIEKKNFDPLNAEYSLEGKSIKLINGKFEEQSAPGSASKITMTLFGTPKMGDLNNDGESDAAIIIQETSGGSGTFYYVAADLNGENKGTNAIFIGDRIAPQTLEIRNGEIIFNYAERSPSEPMTSQPSIGVSKYFKIENNELKLR